MELGRKRRPGNTALTSALPVVQASGEISVHALVRVHSDISPARPFAPSRALKGTPSPNCPDPLKTNTCMRRSPSCRST
jgi:hypothetical protein